MSFKLKISIILAILLLTPIVYAREYEQPTNISGFQDLFQWNNRVVDHQFGIGILIMVFFISFVLLKAFESAQAFTGCLFFTMIVAVGCWALSILNTTWMIGSVLLCALTTLLIFWLSD